MNNQFQQQMSLIRQNNERKRLAELQSKYQTAPDYTNMSLRDELNTRYEIGEMNQLQQKYSKEISPTYWKTAAEGNKIWQNFLTAEQMPAKKYHNLDNLSKEIPSYIAASAQMMADYTQLRNQKFTDKYKHAYINCHAAQLGQGGVNAAEDIADIKEFYDVSTGGNTQDESLADNYANRIGRALGAKYPKGDCNALVEKYIKKHY